MPNQNSKSPLPQSSLTITISSAAADVCFSLSPDGSVTLAEVELKVSRPEWVQWHDDCPSLDEALDVVWWAMLSRRERREVDRVLGGRGEDLHEPEFPVVIKPKGVSDPSPV